MSWPLPTPYELTDRAAGIFESRLAGIDARGPNSVAGTIAKIAGESAYELHLHIAYQAQELSVLTAVDTLDAKAAEWGLARLAPIAARGDILLAGTEGLALPSGLEFSIGGRVYTTTEAVTLGSGSTAVQVVAAIAGLDGDVAGGALMVPVVPIPGLTAQSATVHEDGITGGAEAESDDSLRTRILIEVRKGDEDGTVYYERLAYSAVGADFQVVCKRLWAGDGTAGVIVAGPGPREATETELDAVDAAVQAGRSVGVREIVVLGAELEPVDVTLALKPDTTQTRAAATAAIEAFFAQDSRIGETLYLSRLDNAVSSLSGEYAHIRTAPADDVVVGAATVCSLGTVTFSSWVEPT